MTDIEQEARDLLNAPSNARGHEGFFGRDDNRKNNDVIEAVCRALEHRDAERQAHADFRQRVSDEIRALFITPPELRQFIIPDPVDPLVAVVNEMGHGPSTTAAEELRLALIKHGIPIPDKREEGR